MSEPSVTAGAKLPPRGNDPLRATGRTSTQLLNATHHARRTGKRVVFLVADARQARYVYQLAKDQGISMPVGLLLLWSLQNLHEGMWRGMEIEALYTDHYTREVMTLEQFDVWWRLSEYAKESY